MAEKALRTSVFTWEGTESQGREDQRGTLGDQYGAGQGPVAARQGINPIKVRKKGMSLLGKGKKIKPLDIALFTRQDGRP